MRIKAFEILVVAIIIACIGGYVALPSSPGESSLTHYSIKCESCEEAFTVDVPMDVSDGVSKEEAVEIAEAIFKTHMGEDVYH